MATRLVSDVMIRAAALKREALDRVLCSDDRHTLEKLWQFMTAAMGAARREAQAEAVTAFIRDLAALDEKGGDS